MNKLLISLLLLTACVWAQPVISVENPTHDWGAVKAEETVLEHTFIVKNTGTEDLVISKVKPGCSCTVVDFTKKIAPGKSGTIKSGLKIHKNSKKQSKSITVYSNDPNNASLRLRLKALPLGPANLDKSFSQYNGNVPIKDTLIITTNLKSFEATKASYRTRPSSDTIVTTTVDDITISLVGKTTKPDAHGFYTFTYVASFKIDVTKRESGTLKITTNHPEKSYLEKRCFVDLPQTGK